MEDLINFIIDLANEELYEHLDGNNAREYFLHGGCFEFSKIIKSLIKSSRIVINRRTNSHCGILYERNIYDVLGKVNNPQDFEIASNDDLEYMQERFGIPEKQNVEGKSVSEFLVERVKECNINKLIERIEGEER